MTFSGVILVSLVGIAAYAAGPSPDNAARAPAASASAKLAATAQGGASTGPAPERPGDIVHLHVDSAYRFDTVAEMVATAHVVVEAEVLSVARGDVVGEPDGGHGSVTNRHAEVKVLDVFSGTAPSRLTVSELGWYEHNRRVVANGWPGMSPGDRVILFLTRGDYAGRPLYWALNTTAHFLITDENSVVRTGRAADPAGEALQNLKPHALRDATRAAERLVAKDKIASREPLDFVPSGQPAVRSTGSYKKP